MDLKKCKDQFEIFYQSTLCLFGDRALTPYKLKMGMLLRVFEKVEILPPFYYMTEGTEKSNHTASKDYNTKTMRDGGNDAWSKPSNYLDIQFSFFRAVNFFPSKFAILEFYQKTYGEAKVYLEICRERIPHPQLDTNRTEEFLEACTLLFLDYLVTLRKTS